MDLALDHSDAAGTVWLCAFWFNGRKESGLAGVPVSVNLATVTPAPQVAKKMKLAASREWRAHINDCRARWAWPVLPTITMPAAAARADYRPRGNVGRYTVHGRPAAPAHEAGWVDAAQFEAKSS